MSTRVSPAVIGAFVVGALAVLITAIMVVGSGKLFQQQYRFVCMFAGNLNGLKVGAPVKYSGVEIGSVASIRLALSPDEGRLKPGFAKYNWLPVIIVIDRSRITRRGGTGVQLSEEGFQNALNSGLRAQLNVESILTGLLYVALDLHPNAPLNLVLEPGGAYREIPTIPTMLESVQKQVMDGLEKLNQIDFRGLVASVDNAADSISNLANSPNLNAALVGLQQSTEQLDKTLNAVRLTINNINDHVDPLGAGLQKNSRELSQTLAQTQATLLDVRGLLDPDSPTVVNLNQALQQLTQTTRSLNSFTDYLERNPSAPIRGAYVPAKDR